MDNIGVGSSYAIAWRQLWKHFPMLLIVGIVVVVVSAPSSIMGELADDAEGFTAVYLGVSAFAYHVLFTGPIEYGIAYVYLNAARDEDIELRDVLEGFKDYVNVVIARLMVSVIVGIGFVLLIVPGIIFACRLAFVPYLVVDEKMLAWDAIGESWTMTRGHTPKVFFVGLLSVPIAIAGLICLGVGIIVSIMWVSLAFACLYHAISLSDENVDAVSYA